MRIVFTDATLAFSVNTPYEQPLGGAHAAMCYLAEALAKLGNEVVLVTKSEHTSIERDVTCTGWSDVPPQSLRAFRPHVVIAFVVPSGVTELRRLFGDDAALVLWEQLPADQPHVQDLPAARGAYDAMSFVSDWQSRQYIERFGIDPAITSVIGNAISPAFENMFAASDDIRAAKDRPPVVTYTSAPYRGLNVLVSGFPEIRRRIPGARLVIYSGMLLYQATEQDEQYRGLYDQCRATEGVELAGVLPQPELARRLRSVALYAYPNTFPETYCISAAEAMAAGCRMVTSDYGGLPQTTAGFGRLVPVVKQTFIEDFANACIASLEEWLAGSDADLLARQVAHQNERCTWRVRAGQWTEWMKTLRGDSIHGGL